MGSVCIVTAILAMDKQEKWDDEFKVGTLTRGKTQFHYYLIIFVLQEFIFVAFHIVAYFVLYTLTSCAGCWNGHTISHDDDCKDRFWHYDFIETQLKELNNFVNHPRGRAELEYNRGL